jgi:hypothetical protein
MVKGRRLLVEGGRPLVEGGRPLVEGGMGMDFVRVGQVVYIFPVYNKNYVKQLGPRSQAIITDRRRTCWAPMDVRGRRRSSIVVVGPRRWW